MSGHRKPSELRTMSSEEAAWFGAMVQAEGCIVHTGRYGWNDWTVKVGNTDVETSSTLLRLAGCGWIKTNQRSPNTTYLPYYEWGTSAANTIIDLLRTIAPYLASKQDRAYEAIEELEATDVKS